MKRSTKGLVFGVVLLAASSCGKTTREYFVGERGPSGEQGAPGKDGADGANGQDGEDGAPGPQGPAGEAAVLEVIDPCGDAPGIYDEVILRLANGQLLASFSDNSNGKNTRFSIITPGSYVTTDGSGCAFTVTAAGEIQ